MFSKNQQPSLRAYSFPLSPSLPKMKLSLLAAPPILYYINQPFEDVINLLQSLEVLLSLFSF